MRRAATPTQHTPPLRTAASLLGHTALSTRTPAAKMADDGTLQRICSTFRVRRVDKKCMGECIRRSFRYTATTTATTITTATTATTTTSAAKQVQLAEQLKRSSLACSRTSNCARASCAGRVLKWAWRRTDTLPQPRTMSKTLKIFSADCDAGQQVRLRRHQQRRAKVLCVCGYAGVFCGCVCASVFGQQV